MAPVLEKIGKSTLRGLLPDSAPPLAEPDAVDMSALQGSVSPLRPLLPSGAEPRATPSNLLQSKVDTEADLAKLTAPRAPATGILGRVGRVAEGVGNILGSVFAPGATSLIPGSQLNKERRIGIDQNRLENISQLENEQAGRKQTAALTDFTEQRAPIMMHQVDQRQQAVRDRVSQQAAKAGQKVTWDADGSPAYEDDPDLLANVAQQAQVELRNAQADLANSKNDPSSPAYQQAERRLAVARANAQAAQIRAGAYQGNYLMHAKGVGMDGKPLPGVGMLDGNPVGTSMQGNVNKSLSGNSQFDDVQQGLNHTNDSLTALEQSGSKLSSPAMIAALGHSSTGLGQWLTSQAAASLTPQERDAVVSVNAMRERILAMRKASGGNASEAQVERMISMLPGPQTPDLDTAQRQLREVQAQLNTLRPGVPQVNRPGTAAGATITARDPQGKLHQAAAGTPLPKGWKEEKSK